MLLVPNESPKHADVLMGMFQEVEVVHTAKSQLKQVVVKGFFWNADEFCGVFEAVPDAFPITKIDPVVKLAP